MKKTNRKAPVHAREAYNIRTKDVTYTKKMPDGNRICFSPNTWYPPRSAEERDLLEDEFKNQGPEFMVAKLPTAVYDNDGFSIMVDHEALEEFEAPPQEED